MKGIGTKELVRKLILSLVVLTIGLLSYSASIDSLLEKTSIGGFDERAEECLDDTLKRAVYSFAIARGINGIISVIQDTEIALSPAGIGVTLAVGEILDPINDLIERFSWVMLISSTSLGIQKVLMEVGTWFSIRFILSFSMVVLFAGIWVRELFRINLLSLGYKLILLALLARFCIPAIATASGKVYDLFLKEQYVESTSSLEEIKGQIKEPNEFYEDMDKEHRGSSFWEDLKSRYLDTKENLDIKGRIEFLKDKVSNAIEYTINLIVVFVLQTIIIPIVVLWVLLRLTRYLFGTRLPYVLEQKFAEVMTRKRTNGGKSLPHKAG